LGDPEKENLVSKIGQNSAVRPVQIAPAFDGWSAFQDASPPDAGCSGTMNSLIGGVELEKAVAVGGSKDACGAGWTKSFTLRRGSILSLRAEATSVINPPLIGEVPLLAPSVFLALVSETDGSVIQAQETLGRAGATANLAMAVPETGTYILYALFLIQPTIQGEAFENAAVCQLEAFFRWVRLLETFVPQELEEEKSLLDLPSFLKGGNMRKVGSLTDAAKAGARSLR